LKKGKMMNEVIAKLYDQALALEGNGDYVAGELDPVKFAELIVQECQRQVKEYFHACGDIGTLPDFVILEHFGVEEE
jgi:hypothetical protein